MQFVSCSKCQAAHQTLVMQKRSRPVNQYRIPLSAKQDRRGSGKMVSSCKAHKDRRKCCKCYALTIKDFEVLELFQNTRASESMQDSINDKLSTLQQPRCIVSDTWYPKYSFICSRSRSMRSRISSSQHGGRMPDLSRSRSQGM